MRQLLPVVFAIAACFGSIRPAAAWHAAGHAAVASIAWRDLEHSPNTRKRILQLLRKHPDASTDWAKHRPPNLDEGEFLMMSAALWPDDIRPPTKKDQKRHPSILFHVPGWHFKDIAFEPDGKEREKPFLPEDAVKALQQAEAVLSAPGGGRPVEGPVALAWLTHLVGDIHQPLHAAAFFSDEFPTGDGGGNRFLVAPSAGKVEDLHSLWDGQFDSRADFPFWDQGSRVESFRAASKLADELLNAPDRDQLKTQAGSVSASFKEQESWLNESFQLAKSDVYQFAGATGVVKLVPAIKDRSDPSGKQFSRAPMLLPDKYEENALAIARRRVTLAGFRLAAMLRRLFP